MGSIGLYLFQDLTLTKNSVKELNGIIGTSLVKMTEYNVKMFSKIIELLEEIKYSVEK